MIEGTRSAASFFHRWVAFSVTGGKGKAAARRFSNEPSSLARRLR
jgi:hypothetical protein